MTVRELGDSTEGLEITPINNECIDNDEIYLETFLKLSRIALALKNSIEFKGEKDFFADKLDTFLRESENNKDSLTARVLGIVEVEEYNEEVLTGFYVLFPVMSKNMAREIMGLEEMPGDDTKDGSVLCWYVSYDGETALKMFEYPFVEGNYKDLVSVFKKDDLDDGDDIIRLEFWMEGYMSYGEMTEFIPNSYIGDIDPYLAKCDISKGDSDHQRALFPEYV